MAGGEKAFCLAIILLGGSAAEARFLQADPVGYKDDLNLYVHVNNDPVGKSDPTGLSCVTDDQGKVKSCTFDSGTVGTQAQRSAYLAAFTKAVRTLQKSPGKLVTVKVGGRSFTISSGKLAANMIGRNLVAGPGTVSGSGAETGPNEHGIMTTTVTPKALSGARVPGIPDVRSSAVGAIDPIASIQQYQEVQAVHDAGLHGSEEEQNTFGAGTEIFLQNPNWNAEHQDEYNGRAADALGIER